MRIHEQRDTLAEAIEVALSCFGRGPTLGEFGIAREDCALCHIDYFGGVDMGAFHLANALADVRGTTAAEIWREHGTPARPCDCRSCVGEEAAKEARERHRAAYTNVAEWRTYDEETGRPKDRP